MTRTHTRPAPRPTDKLVIPPREPWEDDAAEAMAGARVIAWLALGICLLLLVVAAVIVRVVA